MVRSSPFSSGERGRSGTRMTVYVIFGSRTWSRRRRRSTRPEVERSPRDVAGSGRRQTRCRRARQRLGAEFRRVLLDRNQDAVTSVPRRGERHRARIETVPRTAVTTDGVDERRLLPSRP